MVCHSPLCPTTSGLRGASAAGPRPLPAHPPAPALPAQRGSAACSSSGRRGPQRRLRAHRVEIETGSGLVVLEMEPGETILEAALDQGVELSHDCKMGVCMTCPAKLVRPRTARACRLRR